MYKYYGLNINGNFSNVLSWIYNKIKNDAVQHNDDESKHMIIYPNTFTANDYISKIYSCVRTNRPHNENYLKLQVSEYLLNRQPRQVEQAEQAQ